MGLGKNFLFEYLVNAQQIIISFKLIYIHCTGVIAGPVLASSVVSFTGNPKHAFTASALVAGIQLLTEYNFLQETHPLELRQEMSGIKNPLSFLGLFKEKRMASMMLSSALQWCTESKNMVDVTQAYPPNQTDLTSLISKSCTNPHCLGFSDERARLGRIDKG